MATAVFEFEYRDKLDEDDYPIKVRCSDVDSSTTEFYFSKEEAFNFCVQFFHFLLPLLTEADKINTNWTVIKKVKGENEIKSHSNWDVSDTSSNINLQENNNLHHFDHVMSSLAMNTPPQHVELPYTFAGSTIGGIEPIDFRAMRAFVNSEVEAD